MSDIRRPWIKPPWIDQAVEHLRATRRDRQGWGYRDGGPSYTEPTVLGCLALVAADDPATRAPTEALVRAGAAWLTGLQHPDGSVGVSERRPTPTWPTAYAALLWSQIPACQGPLARALQWLQQCEGTTQTGPQDLCLDCRPADRGWPWVVGNPSWLEPTAMAMLALCRNQLEGHQRIFEGVRLIRQGAVPAGGWSLRNFTSTRADSTRQPSATGLALLALRGAGEPECEEVTHACQYLEAVLPETRTPEALAWGLLGWKAWRPWPSAADSWLDESFRTTRTLDGSPSRLALLLLAASPTSLTLLGVAPCRRPRASRQTSPV
jgi:hypothetical protein